MSWANARPDDPQNHQYSARTARPGRCNPAENSSQPTQRRNPWRPQISKALLSQATAFGSMTDGTTQRRSLPPDARRLLVASLGVLAAVFALVASNVAANHSPKPHSLPTGMVGTPRWPRPLGLNSLRRRRALS